MVIRAMVEDPASKELELYEGHHLDVSNLSCFTALDLSVLSVIIHPHPAIVLCLSWYIIEARLF